METLEKYSLCNLLSWHRQAVSIIKRQKQYERDQPDIRDALQNMHNNITNSLILGTGIPDSINTSVRSPNRHSDSQQSLE